MVVVGNDDVKMLSPSFSSFSSLAFKFLFLASTLVVRLKGDCPGPVDLVSGFGLIQCFFGCIFF